MTANHEMLGLDIMGVTAGSRPSDKQLGSVCSRLEEVALKSIAQAPATEAWRLAIVPWQPQVAG